MRIEVKIVDDNGDVLAEHTADASQPSMWRAPSGQRFVSPMPSQSDQKATGTYDLFGITFQPHVRVDRPNGYVPPIPLTGNPAPQDFKTYAPPPRPFGLGPTNPLSGQAPIPKGLTNG